MTKALLYCRVSTDDQVENGVSLEAQEQALALEAMRRGYEFEVVREEGKSGKSLEGRDKLAEALDLLDKHKADVLMAVRMDRLSRNVGDVASLMARSKKRGWGIILSGDKLDTTADGKFRTYLDAALAERERDIISVRTKEGMAEKKRQGAVFGRVVDPGFLPTYRRVLDMHRQGISMNAIARTLNDEGVPTAKGGKFYASTIRAMVTSETARTLK
ncbi:recombinase family protein [Microbacterium alcoholitolerans]|uniref:recombinase family protein n=1 Tax=unclassified Microbacterium TaxID=2609290 RepID=UPI003D1833D7